MKRLFAATIAVFFMFAVNGCSDDSNSGTDASDVQENVETLSDGDSSASDVEVLPDASEDTDLDAAEVSDTAAVDVSDSDAVTNDGGNAATD